MSLTRVTRFRFFIFPHLSPKLTMFLHVTTVLLSLKLLMNYSSLTLWKKFVAPRTTVNPLSVSTRTSGKQRLILDLRRVNAFVYKQKFKCEDLSVATQIFDKDYYLFKFDLKSGYHHIQIFPEHHKYLAFAWDFGTGKFRYFQFCVLPFGLSSAPFIFTKILKPLLLKILEKSGHPYCHFPRRWPRRWN